MSTRNKFRISKCVLMTWEPLARKRSRDILWLSRGQPPLHCSFVQNAHIRRSEIAYHCYNEDIVLGFEGRHQVLFWFGNQLFRWCSKGVRCKYQKKYIFSSIDHPQMKGMKPTQPHDGQLNFAKQKYINLQNIIVARASGFVELKQWQENKRSY